MAREIKIEAVREAIPGFIKNLEKAKSEKEISIACQEMKDIVDKVYDRSAGRRSPQAMREIKDTVEAAFPSEPVDSEVPSDFPRHYADNGKGKTKRLEHLAFKYLKDERNPQTDWSDVSHVEPKQEIVVEAVETEVVKPEIDILAYVGLEGEDLEAVKQAISDADISEWVRQAMLQRANAINALRSRIGEDLSEVPSDSLMNDKKYRTNSAAARELVSRAVRLVKQWNLDHPGHKWCITNKILGELTGVTVKAVAKAVEGMDLESYNRGQGLEPLTNRFTKTAVGNPSDVMSLEKVTGVEGTEKDYTLHAVVEEPTPTPTPTSTVETKKKIKQLPANGTSTINIQDFLKSNPDSIVSLKGETGSVTYDRMNDERGVYIGMKCLESGEETKEI